MKSILIFFLFFICLKVSGQVALDSNFNVTITGDVILLGSSKISKAMKYGYCFEKFEMLSCGSVTFAPEGSSISPTGNQILEALEVK